MKVTMWPNSSWKYFTANSHLNKSNIYQKSSSAEDVHRRLCINKYIKLSNMLFVLWILTLLLGGSFWGQHRIVISKWTKFQPWDKSVHFTRHQNLPLDFFGGFLRFFVIGHKVFTSMYKYFCLGGPGDTGLPWARSTGVFLHLFLETLQ